MSRTPTEHRPAMTPAQWQRLESLLVPALELVPDERQRFLDVECGGDDVLRAELESLIAAHEGPGPLDRPVPWRAGVGSGREPTTAAAGSVVSHYEIQELLGSGGMGVVYRADDLRLGRAVALKFLPPTLSSDVQAKTRFLTEARAAAMLDHPNVATVYEIGETDDGQLFIAMAYVEGPSLRERIAGGPASVAQAMDIARQIARGLECAHAHGIVHRDVKPANVMVGSDGVVRLVDFGIAKLSGATVTAGGATPGTAAYMSPEQARGEHVDHRTDLWALGVVLFEMLAGQRPFPGDTDPVVLHAITSAAPPNVSAFRADLPAGIDGLVSRALEKDPAQRFQSAAELEAALSLVRGDARGRTDEAGIRWFGRAAARGDHRRLVRRVGAVGVVIIAAVGAAIFAHRTVGAKLAAARDGTPIAAPLTQRSIAVLPFANLSSDREQDYFSDGITDDILTQLSRIGTLRVTSRTSVMRYKKTDKSLRQIAAELGVTHILEGTVRRDGNRVRIGAQLLDGRNDRHLWAETYDRDLKDIFAIQSEISQRIAAALEAELSADERRRMEVTPTRNLVAYDRYLQAMAYFRRYRNDENDTAARLFREALDMDSTFALAWAGLAMAQTSRYGNFGGPAEWADSAIVSAQRAVALDPGLSEAHATLGWAYFITGLHREARTSAERALALNTNDPGTMRLMGWVEHITGHYDEAIRWARMGLAGEPDERASNLAFIAYQYALLGMFRESDGVLNQALALHADVPQVRRQAIWTYLLQGRPALAVEQARQLTPGNPTDPAAWMVAGEAYLSSGDLPRARKHFERAYAISHTTADLGGYVPVALGFTLWKAGERARARRLFDEYRAFARHQLAKKSRFFAVTYGLAAVNAIEGDKADAYQWLEQVTDVGWQDYFFLLRDPLFETLRGDERFHEILARNKEAVDRMRAHAQREGW